MIATGHAPFTDDGVTYCGYDGHEGCGELWPCTAAREPEPTREVRDAAEVVASHLTEEKAV